MKIVDRGFQIVTAACAVIGKRQKVAAAGRSKLVRPDPQKPVGFAPADLARQQLASDSKQQMRLVGALRQGLASRQDAVVRPFQLQCDAAPGKRLCLQPCRDLLAQHFQLRLQFGGGGQITDEGGFARDAFRLAVRRDRSRIDAGRQRRDGAGPAPQNTGELARWRGDKITAGLYAGGIQPPDRRLAEAEQNRHRLRCQPGRGAVHIDREKTVRLVAV